jgi:hypothetical protein
VRLLGAAVVHGGDLHGGWWRQPGLAQPALQTARGRDIGFGIQAEQVQADTPGPPVLVEATQLQARLAHGQTSGGEGATAAVEVGGEVGAAVKGTGAGQKMPHGASGEVQAGGDLLGIETFASQFKDAQAQG